MIFNHVIFFLLVENPDAIQSDLKKRTGYKLRPGPLFPVRVV